MVFWKQIVAQYMIEAGKVLVQDSTTYRVVVNLKGNGKLKNKDETAAQLADALEINKEDVLKNFHEGRTQVEIGKVGRNLTREKKEQIRKLKSRCIFYA